MKKIIFALAVLVSFTFGADKTVFDVCNSATCYQLILDNVKNWEWKTDNSGRKFVRIYFYNKNILDVNGNDLTVKPQKKR